VSRSSASSTAVRCVRCDLLYSAYKLIKDAGRVATTRHQRGRAPAAKDRPVRDGTAGRRSSVEGGRPARGHAAASMVVAIEAADLVFAVDSVRPSGCSATTPSSCTPAHAFAIWVAGAVLHADGCWRGSLTWAGLAIVSASRREDWCCRTTHKVVSTSVPEIRRWSESGDRDGAGYGFCSVCGYRSKRTDGGAATAAGAYGRRRNTHSAPPWPAEGVFSCRLWRGRALFSRGALPNDQHGERHWRPVPSTPRWIRWPMRHVDDHRGQHPRGSGSRCEAAPAICSPAQPYRAQTSQSRHKRPCTTIHKRASSGAGPVPNGVQSAFMCGRRGWRECSTTADQHSGAIGPDQDADLTCSSRDAVRPVGQLADQQRPGETDPAQQASRRVGPGPAPVQVGG